MNRHVALLVSAVSLSTFCCTAPSNAATWNVTADGLGDAPTIQAAIDLAAEDDSILVHPGTYLERPVAHKSLSVIGVGGAEVTTIDGEGIDKVFVIGIEGPSNGFLIEGLRIVGAGGDKNFGWPYPALVGNSSDCLIRECELESFSIYGATVADCRILGDVSAMSGASVVERCRFEDLQGYWSASALTMGDDAIVRDCTFLRCDGFGFSPVIGYEANGVYSPLTIERNLFLDCVGPCIGPAQFPPVRPEPTRRGGPAGSVVIRGNTFVDNLYGPLGPSSQTYAPYLPGIFEGNIVTGSNLGVWIPEGVPYTVRCNNSFGNPMNWTGIPDPTGIDGNFSADPLFCNSNADDFTLSANSPCLPGNHPDGASCGVIGAFEEGCKAVSIEPESWGKVKARYRTGR